jgi:2-amino-4-hydroxy-6-hydroxymethyldihydropteridine diphosphokinase
VKAFVGLGSNLGDSAATVRSALQELGSLSASTLLARSSIYRTAPIAPDPQPDYINAVAELDTALAPAALLASLLALEARHGRVRPAPNAPRTLDLDLLLYGDRVIDEPGLTVPHPRMHERAFVLRPLIEIAPDCVIPGRGLARDCLSQTSSQRVEVLA